MNGIISFNAKAGGGKDTCCQIIQGLFPNAIRIAFADNVKKFTAKALNISLEQLEKYKNASNRWNLENTYHSLTTRVLLQRIGTECGRELFGENVWINLALKDIDPKKNLYVITDCRFENEAKRVKELGGYVVRINRQEADNVVVNHVSEQGGFDHYIDYEIDNNGTKEDLALAIKQLLLNIKGMRVFGDEKIK